jgi:hypothetical protein
VNPRFLAVILWLLAWLSVSLAGACGWAAYRRRTRLRLAVVAAAGWLLAAAVLANAGADLW